MGVYDEPKPKEELSKCWWCGGLYHGFLMDHICNDGTKHVERLTKPYKVYDAAILDLTQADRNLLRGMNIKI